MRPLIGITCNYDYQDLMGITSERGFRGQTWHYVSDLYISAIRQAGGIPVIIPVFDDFEVLYDCVERMDGFLLVGGSDINPLEYQEQSKSYCGKVVPSRDKQELAFVRHVMNTTTKPILGICRGEQVLNVALGGSLYQDLEQEGQFAHHMCDNYPMDSITQKANVIKGSKLFQIVNEESIKINSFHHQGVKKLGKGLSIVATSSDGVVEAIELDGNRFVIGVQWHPEMLPEEKQQQAIFQAFVKACQ